MGFYGKVINNVSVLPAADNYLTDLILEKQFISHKIDKIMVCLRPELIFNILKQLQY